MASYEIRVPLKGYAVFTVEADSHREARAKHLDGRSDFLDDELSYAVPPFEDHNQYQITKTEED